MENNNNGLKGEQGFYETGAPAAQSYTLVQKLLIPAVLLLGAVFSWVVFGKGLESCSLTDMGVRYSTFWLVYLAAFYAATWRRAKTKPVGWALLALALWLMARFAVYKETNLNTVDFAAIPLVLMLHAAECTAEVPASRQGGYIRAFFSGWFADPFICVPRFFGAIGSIFKTEKDDARGRAVRLGVIAGAALALVVVPLLLASDTAIQKLASGIFEGIDIGPAILRVIFALAVAMLFYSFIFRKAFAEKAYNDAPYKRALAGAGTSAALIILIAIYAVFAVLQFSYLTGIAGLPPDLTYSEYAVHGFSELCTVSAINLAVFAVCVTFSENTRSVRALLAALLGATVLLIASAAVRLVMYVDAYGLTVLRILSFWFMGCLLVLSALCAVKVFRPGMKLLRLAAGAFCALYFALSLLNLDGMIAKSVLARAEAAGGISFEDAYLCSTLSDDAKAAIDASPFADEIYANRP